jgi:hypothetical protein
MAITLGPFRARVSEAGPDDIGAEPGAGCEVAAELVGAAALTDDGDDDVEGDGLLLVTWKGAAKEEDWEEGEAERDTADMTEGERVTATELTMPFEIPRPQTPLVLQ